jgi:GT2 family glycosyltransferase
MNAVVGSGVVAARPAPRISVVIPCHNSLAFLEHCLLAIAASDFKDAEYFVVDDGSVEDLSPAIRSCRLPVQLIRLDVRSGAAAARNAGALRASGSILVFLDADVCVHADTLSRIAASFAETTGLGALMGAYDDHPSDAGFHSRFRNLLHSYTHQIGQREACTFWTGCGAIYRDLFFQRGGFNTEPGMIDDVELGRRLTANGVRIELRPEIKVQHRKRWTCWSWIIVDFWQRGVPWTRLILEERAMPNVLNLSYRNRSSVVMVWLALVGSAAFIRRPDLYVIPLVLVAATLWLNRRFYRFLHRGQGLQFALASTAAHLLHLLVCGASFLAGCLLFGFAPRRASIVPQGLADR